MTRSMGLIVSAPVWALIGFVLMQVGGSDAVTALGVAVLAVAGMAMQAGLIGYVLEGTYSRVD